MSVNVWSYIGGHALPYNSAYDVMTDMGIAPDMQRISTLLDGKAIQLGRFVYLKRMEPAAFNSLARDFPRLRSYA